MEFATGLAILFVGTALFWAAPGRTPFPLPERPTRLVGLALILAAARWFVGAGGLFVGLVEYLSCLSFAGSVIALAAPLRPRFAAVATCCAAVLAVALEIAR